MINGWSSTEFAKAYLLSTPTLIQREPSYVAERLLNYFPDNVRAYIDICCGTGDLTAAFRNALNPEVKVYGLDINPRLLDIARDSDTTNSINWICADVMNWTCPNTFDVATCLFNSFGYHKRTCDNLTFLSHIYDSLNDKGIFLLEVPDREAVLEKLPLQDWIKTPYGYLLSEYNWNKKGSWLRITRVIIDKSHRLQFSIGLKLYTVRGLRRLLEKVGFRVLHCESAPPISPEQEETDRLLFVAYK
ncbi:MAG: methyltransferase domain-containing protein [Thermoflavifilum sp.]|nr:methyltransferase domain-containing protein [Thermoflavifilum sp.]